VHVGDAEGFGALLLRHRLAAGLSQEELAERAGLSQRGISDLERGVRRSPYPATARRLAAALGLDDGARDRLLAARATPLRRARRPDPGPGAERARLLATRGVEPQPAPRAPASVHHWELPRELTSFVGREHELEELGRRLGEAALVTVAGPGGAGKTRLALRLAHRLLERADYPDGVVLAELAPLTDAGQVVDVLAESVGVPEPHGQPLVEVLVHVLRPKQLLLVLDNCEHLLEACADVAARLLQRCPGVRLLATSREPLRVVGEVVYRIPPLGLPADDRPEALAESEAGRLFVQRARAADSAFVLGEANAAAVAQLCRRLDGLPLAIELAAARAAGFAPADLAARLDDALRLAGEGPRDAPPRQRTLEAALAWSHALLDERERRLFRRLAVFAGGFGLEGARAVGPDEIDTTEVLPRLVAKSMVQAEPQPDGTMRYRLLEPLRQFAHARLGEADELDAARRAQAQHVLTLAERTDRVSDLPGQAHRARELTAENDNIRVALDWAFESGDAELAVRLGAALWQWWTRPDRQSQGRVWLERILSLPGVEQHTRPHSRVVVGLAFLRMVQSDTAGAVRLADEANRIAQASGDDWLASVALSVLGTALVYEGDLEAAEPAVRASVQRARAGGPSWIEVLSMGTLGQLALGRGDLSGAEAYILESHRVAQGLDPWTRGTALIVLGDLLRARAEYEAAGRAYEEALEQFRALDPVRQYTPQGVLHNLGYVAMAAGRVRRAAGLFLECADIYRAVGGDRRGLAECVIGLACSAVRAGEFGLAARLFGSAEATLEQLGTLLTPANRADYERGLAALEAGAPAALVAAERGIGRALPLERALEQARVLARATVEPGASSGQQP
jgi:predicted ATPase/transcriptional regulator with XRE-family HTH domain